MAATYSDSIAHPCVTCATPTHQFQTRCLSCQRVWDIVDYIRTVCPLTVEDMINGHCSRPTITLARMILSWEDDINGNTKLFS